MIPTIGFIVAAYAIVRLLQVPLENTKGKYRWIALEILSAGGILVIALLTHDLYTAAVQQSRDHSLASSSLSGIGLTSQVQASAAEDDWELAQDPEFNPKRYIRPELAWLRESPSEEAVAIGKVQRGHCVGLVTATGSWSLVYVYVDGRRREGWIQSHTLMRYRPAD